MGGVGIVVSLSRPFFISFIYLFIIIIIFFIYINETVRFNLPPLKKIRPRIYTTNLNFEIMELMTFQYLFANTLDKSLYKHPKRAIGRNSHNWCGHCNTPIFLIYVFVIKFFIYLFIYLLLLLLVNGILWLLTLWLFQFPLKQL
jgi:hypothetical protein